MLTVAGAFLLAMGVGLLGYWAWPEITWQLGLVDTACPYPTKIADELGVEPDSAALPMGTRIVIPKIAVDQQVMGGDINTALRTGVYHHTGTGSPGEDRSIVIAGHRNRRQFALLGRMRAGDPVILYWNGKEHIYRVTRTYTTDPGDESVLAAGDTEVLRLYTCRPRVVDDTRFVLVAEPED